MRIRGVVNLLSYIAVFLIMTCLVLSYLAKNVFFWRESISDILFNVSIYISLLTSILSAFVYAKTKRNIAFMFFLLVFAVVIVFCLFFL